MEIVNVKPPEIFFGEYRIIIRNFDDSDYNSLIKLLKSLGMHENKDAEKRMYNFALKGYRKLILNKVKNRTELKKEILKYKKSLKDAKITSPIFESKIHSFQFSYSQLGDILAGSWKSKQFDKNEFFSLILSNNL